MGLVSEAADWTPCARGPWCAGVRVVWVDGRPTRVARPTPRPLCDACRGQMLDVLDALPRTHIALLRGWTAPAGRASGPKVSGTPQRSTPLRLDVDSMLRELADTVTSEASAVRDHAGLPPAWWHDCGANVRIRLSVVTSACTTLADRVDTLIAWDSDGERCTALIRLLARARRVAGHDSEKTRIPGVCPTCDARGTLTRWDTDPELLEGVTCGNCGITHTRGDYHARVAREIERRGASGSPDGRHTFDSHQHR
jgi:hypothetical protein